MISPRSLLSFFTVVVLMFSAGKAADDILVVKFDCQGKARWMTNRLADSLEANLKALNVPIVARSRWESLLTGSGYRENDMNYNPPVLRRLVERLDAEGAVYGQVYKKDELLVMDAFYIEAGDVERIDIDPMVGYVAEDLLEMTWDLAVIISKPDKRPPAILKVEPSDSTVIEDEYAEFKLFFDEPMNPDSYGITGEPKDMFFTYGDVEYNPVEYSFRFNIHLYPGQEYKFRVNGPVIKPFMDTTGNVANSYLWHIFTK